MSQIHILIIGSVETEAGLKSGKNKKRSTEMRVKMEQWKEYLYNREEWKETAREEDETGLVIDDDTVYEIDLECQKRKENR